MKNILLTGGAGFIGSNIALKLISKGYRVTVLDNLSKQIHGEAPEESYLYGTIKDKVRFIKGSVTSKEDWLNALQGCDAVIHLAAETGTGQSMYEISKYTEVNIGGTALLLDILANTMHSIKKVIVASSRSIYGEGKYRTKDGQFVYPIARKDADMAQGKFEVYDEEGNELALMATDESSAIHPSSVYGITKQTQEELVLTVCPTLGIEAVAFRFQNVYGPGQSLKNPYTGILSIFSTLIHDDKEINVFEDGKESRDFVYIDDIANATIAGLEIKEANGHVFNVGTGVRIDVLRVCEELYRNYGKDPKIKITGNYRLGDIRHNYADITQLKSILAFEPAVSFEEGIRKFCTWVKGQDIESDGYEKSLSEMKGKGLFK